MRKQLMVLAGLAVTGVAFAAAPEGPKPEGSRGDRPRFERKSLKEALGLTDAQAADLKKLRSDGQKRRIKAQADMKIARLELRDLLLAQTVDEKAVRAKAKQVGDLQAAAANERVEAMLALRKIVTAEQAEKILKHMHKGHGGPDGPAFGRHKGSHGDGAGGPHGLRGRRGPRVSDDMETPEGEGSEDSSAL